MAVFLSQKYTEEKLKLTKRCTWRTNILLHVRHLSLDTTHELGIVGGVLLPAGIIVWLFRFNFYAEKVHDC